MTPPPQMAGARIWVTRPRDTDDELPRKLERAGARIIWAPTIAIDRAVDHAGLDRALAGLTAVDWIAFTSVRAVDAVVARLRALGKDPAALATRQIAAVGPMTARALQRHAIPVAIVAEPHSAEGLIAALSHRLVRGSLVLHPRGDLAPRTLGRGLRLIGAHVMEVVAYRTVRAVVATESVQALAGGVECAVFCSPSAIRGAAPFRRVLANAVVACIGPTTARAALADGLDVHVRPAHATTAALAEAIVAYFAGGVR